MTREEITFIIETLETAIEWSSYASDYFKEKHGLDKDIENVKKSISILLSQSEVKKSYINKKLPIWNASTNYGDKGFEVSFNGIRCWAVGINNIPTTMKLH